MTTENIDENTTPAKPTKWVERWHETISAERALPGVWRRKDGGFFIRGRVTDPRTGGMREVKRALPECKRAREAAAILEAELEKLLADVPAEGKRWHFAEWAAAVFERKVRDGKILAASGRATWRTVLENHLVPAFGAYYVDKLTREDIERFKDSLLAQREHTKDAKRVRKLAGGKYKPATVNKVLAILRQITAAASDEFNIADPCRRVDDVSTRGHRTYPHEAPNALRPDDMQRFIDEARARYPEHFAMVYLGFATGLRPSSLRPLRRRGPNADVKWETGELLVRRSHTHKGEVMDETKTNRDQIIALNAETLGVLRWHCDRLDSENEKRRKRHPQLAEAMDASELLFPAAPSKWNRGGGFRSTSVLDKMFDKLGEILKLGYPITPRAMRRTQQDIFRAAKVPDVVTRSISGHSTPEMQRHYSTASADEQREAMGKVTAAMGGKVIDIATGRARTAA